MLILIAAVFFLISMSFALDRRQEHATALFRSISPDTNIHFSADYCMECHEGALNNIGKSALRFASDYQRLCDCHNYSNENYIHPVDIVPSDEKKENIPSFMPLRKGSISCGTCHDLYIQCGENIESQLSNKRFLRGGPYQKRTDICFHCHDEEKYKKLNPHTQLDENGEIIAARCLYCHAGVPDQSIAGFQDVQLIGDLTMVCQRCHRKIVKHPADADHHVVPSYKIRGKMKYTESQFGIVLPLDYEGMIFCATCHNPHEKGVIPAARLGSKGAGAEAKHRLPDKICMACH
ncbi:MAG: hypothetical protein ISR96_09570 [Nitrospira sp.]|nr:hypothetical protein [Nitrospira sp.]